MSEPDPNLPPLALAMPAGYPQQPAGFAPALPYSGPLPRYHRPGILSAITVISIVVACLSTLSSLGTGCQSGMFYMMARGRALGTSSTATLTTTTGGVTTTTTTSSGPGAFPSVVTPPPVTVSPAPLTPNGATPAISDPTTQPVIGTNPLTPAEIAGAVQRAQKASGNKLSTAQLNALTTALQDPNQELISPGTAWSPVRMASVNPDGSAFITFSGGFVSLDQQGQITMNSMNAGMPNFNVSRGACILGAADALLSLGLAILLFIAAIMVMRNSPGGRRLHLIYALLKIPLTIGGAVSMGWLWSEFYGGISAGIPGSAGIMRTMAGVYAGIFGGLGLIYPIALLIALNTRGVKDYYKPV